MMLLSNYRDRDLISTNSLDGVVFHIGDLRDFIATLSDILKLNVHIVGSYSSGLASRSDSSIDLLVSLDGGQLTASLDNDQLAMALSAALHDWKSIGSIHQQGNQTGMLLCDTRGVKLRMNMYACDVGRIPVSYIFHTVLFTSYARLNTRVPLFITMAKRWARACGVSRRTATESCPLTGFHWTIIALHFLITLGLIPNLHVMSPRTTSLQRVQYGPHRVLDSFATIPNETVGHVVNKGSILNKTKNNGIFEYLKQFFLHLSSTDLLNETVSLQTAGVISVPPVKGWINIIDPCHPGSVNTVNPLLSQKSVVTCAMLIRRHAMRMADFKNENQLAEYMFAMNQLGADSSPNGKVTVAVP